MNSESNQLDFWNEIASKKPGFSELKNMLAAHIGENYPYFDLKLLNSLNFDFASLEFDNWMTELLECEPIDESIKSLYFGLFMWRMDMERFIRGELYVCGSTYTHEDPDRNWTCEINYCPEGKYSGLGIFALLSDIAARSVAEDYFFISTTLHFAVSFCLVHNYFVQNQDSLKEAFLKSKTSFPVGLGYDDDSGTFLVGTLTNEGFK